MNCVCCPRNIPEYQPREIVRQIGGWAAATGGARLGASVGIKTGVGFMAIVGQAGPQAVTPEEVVTIPAGAIVGGLVGSIVGGIGGWISGTTIAETIFDSIFTPVEKEEWVICKEIE